ncbi:MAG: tRNA 2-thiouridine(34) synthase MnmA [Candidatus Zambryskibacteria bacterium CG_4_9_14_3_um_filter_40_16]|uniref:tRNA-specific 2-thiouridylase MnmA n=1 Tax=Candidatus Zambryskibacteria bacterium CG_4_9_14_3_um_filter_40_16 TaxID=1975111 RepID=A0A2M7WU77_9BACT|nr:MAG: tRNA 2-thiouridine(34) synthase MnmA [Candidatus Zambryskibacteria bacterium CG_4_9_14_3_um_filter_40_16]
MKKENTSTKAPRRVKKIEKTVFVGLSGGVDSSVSAALLKQKGYKVTGVFIKGWYPDFLPCEWREERRDAMRVCAKLDIPFLTFDAEKDYKKNVIDYMVSEYKKGRTPNPDIMCNKHIKFGSFLNFAKKEGADFIATGHYARKKEYRMKNDECRYELLEAQDKNKDQSYFLWTLTQKELKHTLFPIGHMQKAEVRILAKKFKLPTALKKDSQGICFLGKVDLKDFLNHYIATKSGAVLDMEGNKIGTHQGVNFLTIGQRHGFVINNKINHSKPLYVVSKNITKNTIVVSDNYKDKSNSQGSDTIILKKTNWINNKPNKDNVYFVRFRYRQSLIKARVVLKSKKYIVNLFEGFRDISEGQSVVVYDRKGVCAGGGIISVIL